MPVKCNWVRVIISGLCWGKIGHYRAGRLRLWILPPHRENSISQSSNQLLNMCICKRLIHVHAGNLSVVSNLFPSRSHNDFNWNKEKN